MSEVRLIDANAIISFVDAGHLRNPLELAWSDNDVVDMIESRPTVDAVPVGFIEALHTYYVRRSKALQGRTGHMYTLYALALEKLVQSFNYVNAMDDEMKTERNCKDGEREPANGYGVMAARMLE